MRSRLDKPNVECLVEWRQISRYTILLLVPQIDLASLPYVPCDQLTDGHMHLVGCKCLKRPKNLRLYLLRRISTLSFRLLLVLFRVDVIRLLEEGLLFGSGYSAEILGLLGVDLTRFGVVL